MNSLKLKPQHETSVIGQLLQLKASIQNYEKNIAPYFAEMESWEVKEYKNVGASYRDELQAKKKYIIENESSFNLILSQYNLSVSVFINKFIL